MRLRLISCFSNFWWFLGQSTKNRQLCAKETHSVWHDCPWAWDFISFVHLWTGINLANYRVQFRLRHLPISLVYIGNSRFPSLGIPRLELENPRWNSYVGHWNSYVGIPMSNVGIPKWVFSFLPRFLPNFMIFQCILYQWMMINSLKL